MSQLTDYSNIFNYITAQETMYKKPVPINDVWNWSMRDHIKTSELYSCSQLLSGKGEFTPVKNITRPILNLQHRTEDIEVKDIQIYVNDSSRYHLSFLVKKYHDDVFVVENDIDTFFDELNVSRVDFGGGLSKQLNKPRPEVVPLQSIAFCDQTDLLSGPIGIKHYYSPDQLLDMEEFGWGNEKNGATATLDEVIALSMEEKKLENASQKAETPGRYIEVYEVHGNLPKNFADSDDTSSRYETRLFIVAFYQKKDSEERGGVILYTAPETKSPFKLIKRDPVYGRALGFGGAEELFESQVWTNYDMIRMQDMLDAASKTIMITQDPALVARHPKGMKDMENMEFVAEAQNGNTRQLDTFPRNLRLFENSINQWDEHAKNIGASQDPLQGKEPQSGTPFASLQAQIQQGMGLHDYRRGQFAKHLEDIYTDWIIPHIQKKITQGYKFLSELTMEELQFVADSMITVEANKMIIERVLSGNTVTPEEVELHKEMVREEFKKKGNKHFIEILKGEFKNVPLAVRVSIAGKSKNLGQATDKIVNIFRFAFSNPQGFAQVMQMPGMSKAFNQILEFSGMNPVDFSGIDKLSLPQPSPIQLPTGMNPA